MKERLLEEIRRQQLMRAGDRVGVAVSGGADSTGLLRLLLEVGGELGVVLSVVHFNHRLRGDESDGDEAFVRELAAAHELELHCAAGDTRAYAAKRKCGMEAAARELRYEYFWRLLTAQGQAPRPELDRIATAHTLEDQAETVVLRMVRGAWTKGLAGIHPLAGEKNGSAEEAQGQTPRSARCNVSGGAIVRPLLGFRRAQLRHYLRRAGQNWREDASNQDVRLARNRVRHELMPKLQELNPAIEEILAETAEIARAEEEYWREVVNDALESISAEAAEGQRTQRGAAINTVKLARLVMALRRRVVRGLAERAGARLEFRHVKQVLDLATEPASRAERVIELPQGFEASVIGEELQFRRRQSKDERVDYEFELPVPGEVYVEAAGVRIRAKRAHDGARLKVATIRIRNWRAGDRYWPAHTATPKKLKELLQDRRVPAGARARWPVVIAGEEIVWVPGLAYPEKWMEEEREGVALEWEMNGGPD